MTEDATTIAPAPVEVQKGVRENGRHYGDHPRLGVY